MINDLIIIKYYYNCISVFLYPGQPMYFFFLQAHQIPNSPEVTVMDGPARFAPCEEEPHNPVVGLLKQFYESKLGALSIGLAVGSLAVFVALRIYKAAK